MKKELKILTVIIFIIISAISIFLVKQHLADKQLELFNENNRNNLKDNKLISLEDNEYSSPILMIVKANGGLRIREKPDKNSKKIGLIPDGQEIVSYGEILDYQTIDGKLGRWMLIKYKGISGYSFSGFLTPADFISENQENGEKITNKFIIKLIPDIENFQYFSSKDMRERRVGDGEISVIYDKSMENFRVITFSPNNFPCNDFTAYCYNFILENDKIILSDMNHYSFGSPIDFSPKEVIFEIKYGCGGSCDSYIQQYLYNFNLLTKSITGTSNYESTNDCSPSKKNENYSKTKVWLINPDGSEKETIYEN